MLPIGDLLKLVGLARGNSDPREVQGLLEKMGFHVRQLEDGQKQFAFETAAEMAVTPGAEVFEFSGRYGGTQARALIVFTPVAPALDGTIKKELTPAACSASVSAAT